MWAQHISPTYFDFLAVTQPMVVIESISELVSELVSDSVEDERKKKWRWVLVACMLSKKVSKLIEVTEDFICSSVVQSIYSTLHLMIYMNFVTFVTPMAGETLRPPFQATRIWTTCRGSWRWPLDSHCQPVRPWCPVSYGGTRQFGLNKPFCPWSSWLRNRTRVYWLCWW